MLDHRERELIEPTYSRKSEDGVAISQSHL
jgi:hypothetical protein